MTKKFYPVVLKFAFNSEYSIDNGTTWTTLAAGTRIELDPTTLPADGKVTVRSAETVTRFNHLDRDLLELQDRMFETVNIRNMKNVTDVDSLFYNTFIDNIRIANCQNVTKSRSMMSYVFSNNIDIGHMPNVTDAYKMFNYSIIKALSSLSIGKHDTECNFQYFMAYSTFNYMGDIKIDGNLNDYGRIMFSAKIDVFPNVVFLQKNIHNNNRFSYAFSYLDTPYVLDTKLLAKAAGDHMFYFAKPKFMGLDLKFDMQSNSSMCDHMPNIVTPFARLIKAKSNSYMDLFRNVDLSKLNPELTAQDIDDLAQISRPALKEIVTWLPEIIELSSDTEIDVVGITSMGAVGLRYRIIENASTHILEDIAPLGEWGPKSTEVNTLASDTVWFCRNGWYAVQDGADIKIYDEADTLISTISNVTGSSAGFTNDAQKLYVVTGEIDKTNTSNQTVVQDITVYNTSDATVHQSLNISDNGTNEQIVGIHRPDMGSNIQIVKTIFSDGGVGLLVPSTSKVEARASINNVVKTINLSDSVDYVCGHYVEDNEFCAVNRVTGKSIRCFGK